MQPGSERIRESRLWMALPVFAAAVAYASVVDGAFVWDDTSLIEAQPRVRELQPAASYLLRMFWTDPLDPSRSFYRPLVTLSYALEWRLWDGAPAGFHLTNLGAHLLVLCLLLLLCRRAGAGPLGSGLSVALFGVFPRLTESVAWISGRTDVFAAVLGLGAWLLLGRRAGPGWRTAAAAVLLLAAILCKEVALALVPGLALTAWRAEPAASRQRRALRLLPLSSAVAVALLLRMVAQRADAAGAGFEGAAPELAVNRLLASLAALGHYAAMVLDPFRPRLQIGSLTAPSATMALLGAAVALVAAALIWSRRRALDAIGLSAIVVLAGSLGLVLHVFPLQMPGLAADRFLYVPLAMGALLLSRPLDRLAARAAPAVALLGCALVLAFAVRTHQRVQVWNDEYTLFREALEHRPPGATGALLGLAGVLLDAELPRRALPYLEQLLEEERAAPNLKSWNTYAVALDRAGEHDRAIALLRDLAGKQPGAAKVWLNLAMASARAGRWEEASAALDRAAAAPGIAEVVARVRGQLDEARRRLQAVEERQGAEALAERASVADLLGATADAERLWRAVLRAPDASPAQQLRAAGYLAFHGEPSAVAEDLRLARTRLGGGGDVTAFERVVAERDRLR